MAEGLVGRKIGCTHIFQKGGEVTAVTLVKAGPCQITAKRTQEKHGYTAIQVGFEKKKEKKVRKPEKGAAQASGGIVYKLLREFRVDDPEKYEIGQELTVGIFAPGDRVRVTGRSIGKGFQGVVKRHHHHGGPKSHGSMFDRAPGSIGSSAFPSRVIKGRALPGHMGDRRVTIRNIEVVQVRADENVLVLKGAVPGPPNQIVFIEKMEKKS